MDAAHQLQAPIIEFGRFKVDRRRREFLADGHLVELGGRAFDTLVALLEAHGAVASKDVLMRRIWPDQVVEENNLEIQIWSLRKALGVDRTLIRTVPRRGYQFIGAPQFSGTAGLPAAPTSPISNLPVPISDLIGREEEIREVTRLAMSRRLVTLIGSGGIGKTRLGLEVARQLRDAFPDGAFLVDLAPLSRPELIPVTVAATLGLPVADPMTPERVAAAGGSMRRLLVLDNCEHLIDGAAGMAHALLRAGSGISLLATSREPLRAEGEYVYRVPCLGCPPEEARVEEIFQHDAVKLFVTRARAAEPRFTPDARIAAPIAAICRRLDGMPLAIELAAARVPALGTDGIASHLDDRFALLASGTRSALPRHQTLRATLDWSYELLTDRERTVLRRLAVFAGSFLLDEAAAVSVDAGLSALEVIDALGNLVTKSLLSAEVGALTRYRLLETTRAYAIEKLAASGDSERLARRHAEYYVTACDRTELKWDANASSEWMAAYGPQIENVRVALDWAFSPHGDAAIGVALTVASVPLWMHLSLTAECLARVRQAMASLESLTCLEPRQQMRLFLALGSALVHTRGGISPEMNEVLAKALEIAETVNDTEHRLRAMYGLYVYRLLTGDHRGALAIGQRFRAVAGTTTDPDEALVGDRLVGFVLHSLGDQPGARRLIEPLVSVNFDAARRSHIIRYQFDQRVVIHTAYARILWMQGYSDEALQITDRIVDYARTRDHTLSLLYALFHAACPIAVYVGSPAVAEHYVTMVLDLAQKDSLKPWKVWGQAFQGALRVREGDGSAGVRLLREAFKSVTEGAYQLYTTLLLAELAEGLAITGQTTEALGVIDEALTRADLTEGRWCIAELWRRKGELLLRHVPSAVRDADDCFGHALDWATRQGALAWELRAATSRARLYHRHGRTAQARKVLAPVYRRFTEGLKTPDLVVAKALLGKLR